MDSANRESRSLFQPDLRNNFRLIRFFILFFLLHMSAGALGFCRTSLEIWNQLRLVEDSKDQSTQMKRAQVRKLKTEFDSCHILRDSVYARILHRLALYDYLLNGNKPTPLSLQYTLEAIGINAARKSGSSETFAVNSYSNLAMYYRDLRLYDKALAYYDSTMLLVTRYPDQKHFLFSSRYDRSNIFFHTGKYQQSIDESYSGYLESKSISDTSWMLSFLNQVAQAHFLQNELSQGLVVVDKAIPLLHSQLQLLQRFGGTETEAAGILYFELATAFKTKALIYEQMNQHSLAEEFFKKTIENRVKSTIHNSLGQVAGDYSDFGNFYLSSIKSFSKANACYLKTLEYAQKAHDDERMAKAYLSLGQSSYQQQQFKLAESYYLKSINLLVATPYPDFAQQPTSIQVSKIVNSEFVLVYLQHRIQLLVTAFKRTRTRVYLDNALKTALLADTLITRFRHQQTGEQSKLFWRTYTRGIYSMGMEVAFLKNDPAIAFLFMEKSRAVLLNDRLNELGSFAYLPAGEALKGQQLQNQVLVQQEATAVRSLQGKIDDKAERNLLEAKENLLRYIQSLEKKYPAYYQYKYSDSVPSLADLEKYLSANNQTFVHYFMGDTVSYALSVSTDGTRMLRIDSSKFKPAQVSALLAFFSDKQLLNNQYSTFASQSYRFYTNLFEPLHVSKGRVVICPDNFLVPFEALGTNEAGTKLLINDYAFTYIYSARYLLKQFTQHPARGNFLGFAPVSFQSYLRLAELRNSSVSLEAVAENYKQPLLYKTRQATRQHFLSSVGKYDIVNVFSHARADEASDQPMLFMHDSVIRLSELQYLREPSTKLVVLSACETTVGKNATGEGIYSLARGFAAAGIPSVAATIWKADEQAIYSISELFHQYLAKGLPMDLALQKAKLAYIKTASREQLLPYYWANMVIIGKVDPIELEKAGNNATWYIFGISLVLICVAVFVRKRRRRVT